MLGHEFTIPHRIDELFKIFGLTNNKDTETKLADLLIYSRTPFVSNSVAIHQAKLKCTEASEHAEAFIEKYEDLKGKNVRDVDAVLCLLAEISKSKEIKSLLATSVQNKTPEIHESTAKRLHLESRLLDHSSNSSNTGSGGTRHAPTAQQLAEMKEKVLRGSITPVPNFLTPTMISTMTKALIEKTNAIKLNQEQKTNLIIDYPSWCKDKPFLSWDFYPNPEKFEADSDINKMSISMQEDMIIEDLLNCMSGIEGKYIKTPSLTDKYGERTFHIDRSLDSAMRDLAKRILPVCSYYSIIIRFVEEKSNFKWGLTNHALCAAIRELLKNHFVFVCQLENIHRQNNLSLQKLWYYVSPIMNYMEIISTIVKIINKGECKGSSILDLLYEKIKQYSGDQKVQELIYYLAQMASKPYFSMLDNWLHKGVINDPYNEFMIVEDKEIAKDNAKDDFNDKYWDRKYNVKRENTPKFFEGFANRILLTGKYLNAVKITLKLNMQAQKNNLKLMPFNNQQNENSANLQDEQFKKLTVPGAKEIIFSIKEENYKEIIDNAYDYSNRLLLDLLLHEYKLLQRLKSLKHYFLLDQSDFMVHFMDIAEEELKKEQNMIKVSRLESLLELSLRITSANSDPYKDDLRVKLFSIDLKTMLERLISIGTQNELSNDKLTTETSLTGLELFSLDYVVKWPLSLIINEATFYQYQILFRHIFYMKHVERQLCNVWLCTKSGELCLIRSSKAYALACALKQRMLNFVQNLLNYMTFEVFEANWSLFESKLTNITNIDDLIMYHTEFLNSCLRDCILTSKSFRNLHKIFSICAMFADYVQATTQDAKNKEETIKSELKYNNTAEGKLESNRAMSELKNDLNKIINGDDFGKTIALYDKNFSQVLLDLLAKIMNEMSENLGQTKIGNIVNRLDFNDHYREQLEKIRLAKQMQNKENVQKIQATLDLMNSK